MSLPPTNAILACAILTDANSVTIATKTVFLNLFNKPVIVTFLINFQMITEVDSQLTVGISRPSCKLSTLVLQNNELHHIFHCVGVIPVLEFAALFLKGC